MMRCVSYTLFSRDPAAVPVANLQRAIYEPLRRWELSLLGEDREWEDTVFCGRDDYIESLQFLNELPEHLALEVGQWLEALNEAHDYVTYSQAASIFGLSEFELRQDIKNGHIPVVGNMISTKTLMFLVATNVCW